VKTERGQALILIALGMVALLALTGLALDGGMAFAGRRSSQNAADNAAMAAAYSRAVSGSEKKAITAAQQIALGNGYTDENSILEIEFTNVPSNVCGGHGVDVTVHLTTSTDAMFAPIVGVENIDNRVTAVARTCFSRKESLVYGNAIVGLNPNGNSFETTSKSASWTIYGGGIFANDDAYNQNTTVSFPDGHCVTAVGNTTGKGGFGCQASTNNPALQISYPQGAAALLPPPPSCSGNAVKNGNSYSEESGYSGKGSKVAFAKSGNMYFAPGIYCITGADKSSKVNIYGHDVLFYVMNPDTFEMKFAGGGGFFTTRRVSGPPEYNGYMLIIPMSKSPCTSFSNGKPSLELRGNGDGDLTGTILAPSSCIDYRGNASTKAVKSQIIGYIISSNGGASVIVDFDASENRLEPKSPSVELLE
jgi:Flp pilus assembly protein TadG